ncbi:hypothetical protein [Cylindrospermum sp. FACHB-282]|uniref:hypothetical protein n=1 Tax=Cylindrospermum sp. FACHB-282 TaxID=2692794 RepID=UPI001683DA0F|nr:hypothetical protein [Cylindrospermum sp. FACHB-282]MBD2385997.1 hypothetical protein [Cylindrospermum sp. FACHB-282]
MKLLTGFQPKALLTAKCLERRILPKERLIKVIEYLDSENALNDCNSRLLEAIICGIMWSEETDEKIKKLGLEMAIEQFHFQTINWDHEDIIASPDNPDNWKV